MAFTASEYRLRARGRVFDAHSRPTMDPGTTTAYHIPHDVFGSHVRNCTRDATEPHSLRMHHAGGHSTLCPRSSPGPVPLISRWVLGHWPRTRSWSSRLPTVKVTCRSHSNRIKVHRHRLAMSLSCEYVSGGWGAHCRWVERGRLHLQPSRQCQRHCARKPPGRRQTVYHHT
ncbi:hypothetical protein C8Q80DRAFT_505036 [Daedaleopsis nitida]|nr:hypothetical protein C8Q80DRAFT_505036 [Daedaleopsis nitida]